MNAAAETAVQITAIATGLVVVWRVLVKVVRWARNVTKYAREAHELVTRELTTDAEPPVGGDCASKPTVKEAAQLLPGQLDNMRADLLQAVQNMARANGAEIGELVEQMRAERDEVIAAVRDELRADFDRLGTELGERLSNVERRVGLLERRGVPA